MTSEAVSPGFPAFAGAELPLAPSTAAQPDDARPVVTGLTPTRLTEAQAAALDDAQELSRYTKWSGEGDQRTACSRVLLDGLHCAACSGLIETAAQSVPGVLSVKVNGATRVGEITWDPRRTRPSAWVAAIGAAGYGAYPDTGVSAVDLHRAEARKAMWRLFVAAFCMMQVMMYATPSYVAEPGDLTGDLDQLLRWASWVLSVPVLLFSSGPFFKGAWQALRRGHIGMDVPVALGVLVTFIASSGATFDRGGVFGSEVYFDSMTMFVTFLLGGRYLELWARSRTAQSLDGVLRRLPDSVERVQANGQFERVNVHRLAVGDRIRITAGQAFAADGVILEGHTRADEALLTGESRPVLRGQGDAVVAGSYNLDAPVLMEVRSVGDDTHYQRIVDLMQRAVTEKPALVRAADRIAGPFLWGVLVLAALSALAWQWVDPQRSIWVAVSVLIVTCPCALSLAAPAAMLTAAGALARRGVLVQRLDALEALSQVDRALFDKTGTLTDDHLTVARVRSLRPDVQQAVALAAARTLARQSTHPLSRAVAHHGVANGEAVPLDPPALRQVHEVAGQGLAGTDAQGQVWRLGALAWVSPERSAMVQAQAESVSVWLADAKGPALVFEFEEQLRADAHAAVAALQRAGVQVELLSGDASTRAETIGHALGLDRVHGNATPQDKLDAVAAAQADGHRVLAVGDGLNDAPLLARANVSIAMAHGAALAQSRADFVMTGGQLLGIAQAKRLAQRTMRVVRQNMVWAVLYNLVCVPLAMLGMLPPWLAGLGMALSSLLVILNAMRLGRHSALKA